jgi:hypothetical protein
MLILVLLLAPIVAFAQVVTGVGFAPIAIHDPVNGGTMPGYVFYPSMTPSDHFSCQARLRRPTRNAGTARRNGKEARVHEEPRGPLRSRPPRISVGNGLEWTGDGEPDSGAFCTVDAAFTHEMLDGAPDQCPQFLRYRMMNIGSNQTIALFRPWITFRTPRD